jgi:hypothetical protein
LIALNAHFIQQHCLEFDPPTARFVIENALLQKIALDGDTTAILLETARHDKPDWKPRTETDIERDKLVLRGLEAPVPREPLPPPTVESKEEDVLDVDEPGEEKPL